MLDLSIVRQILKLYTPRINTEKTASEILCRQWLVNKYFRVKQSHCTNYFPTYMTLTFRNPASYI